MARSRRVFLASLTAGVVGTAGCKEYTGRDETPTAYPQGPNDLRWRYETGAAVFSSPTTGHGRVYVGSQDGYLYALNRETGSLEWRFETGDEVNTTPTVSDRTVFIGSYDNTLYALAPDGTEKWGFETGGVIGYYVAVADGTVYFGSGDNRIYALDATSGTKEWEYPTGDYVLAGPVVSDGALYVGSGGGSFYAIDLEFGTALWEFSTGSQISSAAVVEGDTVFFGTSDKDSPFYALDRQDGSTIWTLNFDAGFGTIPAIADGTLYFGDYHQVVRAVDAATGTVQWKTDLGSGTILSGPTVSNGLVYIGDAGFGEHSALNALNAETGELRWRYVAEDFVHTDPLVQDDTVYFGSHDSHVYAIEATPEL